MDFRGVESVVSRWTGTLDSYSEDWLGLAGNPLEYLQDEQSMTGLADQAYDYEQLAQLIPYAKQHIETIAENKKTLEEFNAWYAEYKQKTLSEVAKSLLKAKKANSQFAADLEVWDAKARAADTKIEQGRRHSLEFIAKELAVTMEIEANKHRERLADQDNRFSAEEERKTIAAARTERREALKHRLRYGTKGLPGGTGEQFQIPVVLNSKQQGESGAFGTLGNFFGSLWHNFREAMKS